MVRWTAWQLCWDSYGVYEMFMLFGLTENAADVFKIFQERSFDMNIFGDHEIPGLQLCLIPFYH